MSDPGLRNFQLSRKQLAFGVISAVGVSVVVFLLGVSVGRGVVSVSASQAPGIDRGTLADAASTTSPQPAPDGSYSATGNAGTAPAGSIAMKVAEPPMPPPELPASKSETPIKPDITIKPDVTAPSKSDVPAKSDAAPKSDASAKSSAPKSSQATAPAVHAPAKPDTQKPAPVPARGDWFVQMGTFKSKPNADNLVAKLKAAGYAAFELSPQAGDKAPMYRVRVGPFVELPEAEKAASRLTKEGYQPSVTR